MILIVNVCLKGAFGFFFLFPERCFYFELFSTIFVLKREDKREEGKKVLVKKVYTDVSCV